MRGGWDRRGTKDRKSQFASFSPPPPEEKEIAEMGEKFRLSLNIWKNSSLKVVGNEK
jgi:hypothetical protein